MQIKEIVKIIELNFPKDTALEDDKEKIGYEVSFDETLEITKVITTLDVTPKIIEYAIDNGVKLIITHHPLFYNGLEEELKNNEQKYEMYTLIKKHKITIYAAHTNVDVGENGMSYRILHKIGIKPVWFLDKETHLGAVAYLEPKLQFGHIIELFMKFADLNFVRYLRNKEKEYKKIAFVAGAGSSLINNVVKQNIELFITSDIPWHAIVYLQTIGVDVIEVSHSIENEFKSIIADLLKNHKIEVIQAVVPDLTKIYANEI